MPITIHATGDPACRMYLSIRGFPRGLVVYVFNLYYYIINLIRISLDQLLPSIDCLPIPSRTSLACSERSSMMFIRFTRCSRRRLICGWWTKGPKLSQKREIQMSNSYEYGWCETQGTPNEPVGFVLVDYPHQRPKCDGNSVLMSMLSSYGY
jgi:hypothetical protein